MSQLDITRRSFLTFAAAASAVEVGLPPIALADPPNPNLNVTPQAEIANFGVGDVTVHWHPNTLDCSYEVKMEGPSLDGVTETRTFQNVATGLVIDNLPSRALFHVSIRAKCGEEVGEWSAPASFSTRLPAPGPPIVSLLALGGAEVRWNLTFPRPVIDRTGLALRVFRTRGSVGTLVADLTDDIETGVLIDGSFGPGDEYQLQVAGKYLTHPGVDDESSLSTASSAGVAFQAHLSNRLAEHQRLLPSELNVFTTHMWDLF